MGSIHWLEPSSPGFNSRHSQKCPPKIYGRYWLEESGQRLADVYQTHLVVAAATNY